MKSKIAFIVFVVFAFSCSCTDDGGSNSSSSSSSSSSVPLGSYTLTIGSSMSDTVRVVKTDSHGNAYIIGEFQKTVDFDPSGAVDDHTSNGETDCFVTKINADGSYGWTKTFGGGSWDTGFAVALDGLGHIYIVGRFRMTADFDPGVGVDNHTANGEFDVFITKLNLDGSYLWTRSFGKATAKWIDTDSVGNVYAIGEFSETVDFDPGVGIDNHTSSGYGDVFLTKLNADGSYGWTKTFGGSGDESAVSIALDGSDNLYITGCFKESVVFDPSDGTNGFTSNGEEDIFVSKLSADGSYGWTKVIGGSNDDTACTIATDGSGDIYLAGRFTGGIDFNPGAGTDIHTANGTGDAFLTKLNADGSYGWTKTFSGGSFATVRDVAFGVAGNIYICGSFGGSVDFDPSGAIDDHTSNGETDAFVTKLDAAGNHGWTKTFGGTFHDAVDGISLDPFGNIYITGSFSRTVDFGLGSGTNNITSLGFTDLFIMRLTNN